MNVNELINAYEAYEIARRAVEEPDGVGTLYTLMTFRSPTPEEYAGEQIVRYAGADAALKAMQQKGQKVDAGFMDTLARSTATIIAAAMIK